LSFWFCFLFIFWFWFCFALFFFRLLLLVFVFASFWPFDFNPCAFVPIDFLFQIENTNSECLCFSNFKFQLKIENHPFFSDFRFFSFLFVAENVVFNINFFQKISSFSFPFFSSFLPIENRKMKIFKPLILI